MKRYFKSPMLRILAVFAAAALLIAASEPDIQRMLRGQELIVTIYRLILSDHVENIPPDALLDAAVRGMFTAIDPYAEFIEERGTAEMDILNRGAYGGLGIKILTWENKHIVSFIYDAVRPLTELRPGDIILEVDSVKLNDGVQREMRDLLRGAPGTFISLRILRPGIQDTLNVNAQRRDIEVTPIPYAVRLESDVAYVKLARFSRNAADSLRQTLLSMMRDHALKGVILDLRDNPGGLLESAVSVVSMFVPVGSPVVSMRGRDVSRQRNYASAATPILPDIPLAVLVNRKSASASEIVAGAIQDLDRGIVIGARTFGKGLVQNILPMNYGTSLKLTTAKYYLPSGRCIQRFQYVGGRAVTAEGTDSSGASFRTLKLDRDVRQSNGVIPDLAIQQDTLPAFIRCLQSTYALFRFASEYRNTHAGSIPSAEVDMQKEFTAWLSASPSCLDSELRDHFTSLLRRAEQYDLDAKTLSSLRALDSRIAISPASAVRKHWDWLKKELNLEFTLQAIGEREYIARSVTQDEEVLKARSIILDHRKFQATLQSGPDY